MKLKNIPLWVKIISGMILGILWGLAAVYLGLKEFTLDWIKPFGTIFLDLLKLIAVPLIFVSLVKGISSLTDISRLSRMGLKTIGLYLVSTLIATTLGLGLVNTLEPGDTFPKEKQEELQQRYEVDIEEKELTAEQVQEQSPLQFLVDMVPENIVNAASNNRNMLQIIFFAILFAIAMVLIPEERIKTVKDFFDGINEIILKIIDFIMKFAPYGVFALLAALIVEFSGDADLFVALANYAGTVVIGLFFIILVIYPFFIRILAGVKYGDFFRAIFPAQMFAFTTSSSAATLPVTLRQTQNKLGVSKTVSNFVLPIGVTINMDGTSCYQAIAAVFIAQVFGLDLNITQQVTIVLTATLSSIGTPGVPGGSIIMLVIVLSSVGLPAAGLALILGIDRPLDMLRTVVNITGDSTVSTIVSKSEGDLNYPVKKEQTV
ncbi:MAG: dicarboxylate/amino acid:cation symporter [Bacteroidota bacterium]